PRTDLRGPSLRGAAQRHLAAGRADAAEHRLTAGVALGVEDGRRAARDPVGVRVDAEPDAAAGVVWRRCGARRGRPCAAARDARALAVLPDALLDARDVAVQDRPRRRRAL